MNAQASSPPRSPMDPDPVAAAPASMTEREAWAVLQGANGLGPVGFGRLLRRHGCARTVIDIAQRPDGARALVAAGLPGDDLEPDEGDNREGARARRLDPGVAAGIVAAAQDAGAILEQIAELELQVMTLEDKDYPTRLLALELPPPVLFVRGERAALSADRTVAVVGTRRATEAGQRLAREIGLTISRAGGVVVSGLALGIDGAAHSGAVAARLPTVAVLGTGHAELYPRAHLPLAGDIVATGGCVISELVPFAKGTRGTFPRRNRVISGLSDATVVVEAPPRSGALITAGWAMEQGRECFLVPGPVGAPQSAGCLRFLREYHGQARIVATVVGLLEDLGFQAEIRPATVPSALDLGETEERLATLVSGGHATVDSLVATTGLAVSTVLSGLTLLEMRGLVAGAYGRYRAAGILVPGVEVRRRGRRADAART